MREVARVRSSHRQKSTTCRGHWGRLYEGEVGEASASGGRGARRARGLRGRTTHRRVPRSPSGPRRDPRPRDAAVHASRTARLDIAGSASVNSERARRRPTRLCPTACRLTDDGAGGIEVDRDLVAVRFKTADCDVADVHLRWGHTRDQSACRSGAVGLRLRLRTKSSFRDFVSFMSSFRDSIAQSPHVNRDDEEDFRDD